MIHKRGTLFLVVGPSGAGKDSLIEGAKSKLDNDEHYVFPQRYITRPMGAGGEDHIPVSQKKYDELLSDGKMLLHWQAHNLGYGIPISVGTYLDNGRHVIINVSRTIVDSAQTHLAPVKVLYVTVPKDVLMSRLKNRGRESISDIKRRVARADEYKVTGDDVCIINNDGDIKESIADFVKAIRSSPLV